MAVTLNKNGRPTKASKALVKKINSFLSNLNEEDRANYSFSNEAVKSSERLEDIWAEIIEPNDLPLKDNEFVDESTGEVFTKEEIKENIE